MSHVHLKTTSHAIRWYDGTVEEAFDSAKEEDKPLFMYWGAVWCPPCQELKHTVFKSRRFIRQSESFVPVYLDGDTSTAQALGEKFAVRGYPTMIIFNSQGTEITRIPGGIDVSIYNDILALSQEAISPTSELVLRVLNSPETITEKNLKQLAYYSWGQDHNALPENYSPELFLGMSEMATDEISSARLYMQYLYEVAEANGESQSADTATENSFARQSVVSQINYILQSAHLDSEAEQLLLSELKRLNENLGKWQSEKQITSLVIFTDTINQRCQQQVADSTAAANCASLI